jgi:hypothetical protein
VNKIGTWPRISGQYASHFAMFDAPPLLSTQNTMSGSQQSTDDYPLPPVFSNLSNLLEDHPESFATGNVDIHIAALNATKHIFDLGMFFFHVKC